MQQPIHSARPVYLRLMRTALITVILLTTVAVVRAVDPQPVVPAGFTEERVAKTPNPTGLAALPDGRMLIIRQTGQLHLWQEGQGLEPPVILDMSSTICVSSARGLLGVVPDPNFANNGYFYLYFTRKMNGSCPKNNSDSPTSPVERISRFTFDLGTSSVVKGSELVLLDGIPSRYGDHTGGDMHFAPDGSLYVTTGDGDSPAVANNGDSLRGKMLRINSATGDGIPGNPFFSDPNAVQCGKPGNIKNETKQNCREIFAVGLRHPWRMAFKPGTDEFRINDVGKQTWEEINIGALGADYEWDAKEGPCKIETKCTPGPQTPPNDPIFWYYHTDDPRQTLKGCTAITGAAFVPPGIWPAEYEGDYLFADYTCGRIWQLEPDGATYKEKTFVNNIYTNSVSAMKFAPATNPTNGQKTLALYYTVYNGGGQMRRVIYTSSTNHAPFASATATYTPGNAPLDVTFDASASSDPDSGDQISSYDWDFGDGVKESVTSKVKTHSYNTNGTFTAKLKVRDTKGQSSDAFDIRIDIGNKPPTPVIVTPALSYKFKAGEMITLQGNATDAEDGALADSALTWEVIRHHDAHTHPELPSTTGNNITFQALNPEGISATQSSYLEIFLTATDSHGVQSVITQTLYPNLVDLTFTTEPAGLQLAVDDLIATGPQTLASWEGYQFNVGAPVQQDASGQWMVFDTWNDGAATSAQSFRRTRAPQAQLLPNEDTSGPSRTIVTPAAPTSYEAHFKPLNVELASSTFSVGEGASSATVAVVLNTPSTEPLTVHYSTSDGTAIAGSDYTPISGTLSFAPGEIYRSFDIPLVDDGVVESDESLTITLSDPAQVSLGATSSATLTIGDDDDPTKPQLGFSTDTTSVRENAGAVTLTVQLDAATTQEVSVQYATSNGSATADSDYSPASGSISFAAGETSKTITVPIIDDQETEAAERLTVTLSAPNQALLGPISNNTIIIVDNDGGPAPGGSQNAVYLPIMDQ